MTPKYEQLVQRLRAALPQWYADGQRKLPGEQALAAQLSVSRQTLRQALAVLEQEGLIEKRRGSGSFLCPAAARQDRRIAVIATSLSDYIFPSLLKDVQACLSAQGFSVVIHATENSIRRERDILQQLLLDPPAGILVEGCKTALPNPNAELYQALRQCGLPMTFLHGSCREITDAFCVGDDNYGGGYLLAGHLIRSGHKKIAGIFKSDDAQGPDRYHGVGKFDVETGQAPESAPSFSTTFGECLCRLAKDDPEICAITAAMKTGTCLQDFSLLYPERFFDVGIAEGHAVTFSSGLACGGILPVFAVYSTFLQRSYDQILNDTSIIGNHIVLAIDRAGIVPDDGETHQGIFDVPFLTTIPHVTIYAPFNFAELEINLKQALYDVKGIAAVRYPKGGELPCPAGYVPNFKPYTYLRSGKKAVLLITYGRIFANVLSAAKELLRQGLPVSVLKLTRIHPLDEECVQIARRYSHVLFFEEGSRRGGIGEYLGSRLMAERFSGSYRVRAIEDFLTTCSTASGLHQVGLDVEGIVAAVLAERSSDAPAEEPDEPA